MLKKYYSRDHTPKTLSCAFMHIHLFRSSLLKIGDTRPWVYDTRTCNRFEHENQSNLSGVVTTISPFPSSRTHAKVLMTRPMMDTMC
jgi:hypothetical protein